MYTSNRKNTMTDYDITEIADARYMGLILGAFPWQLPCQRVVVVYL